MARQPCSWSAGYVKAPGQLGPFVAEAVQFTDARGSARWIPYNQIAALEFTEPPLLPPAAYR
jgi:hypothetical protein